MTDQAKDEYITIFGVNNENLYYIEKIFSKYNPIYANVENNQYGRPLTYVQNQNEIPTEPGSKNEKSNKNKEDYENKIDDTFQGYFEETPDIDNFSHIENAFLNSTGNWIHIKVSKDDFNNIIDQKSKFVLENNDIIYCIKGKYQGEIKHPEFPTNKEKLNNKSQEIEPIIYKMPKIKNLTNLSFEGKSFNLKFNEFILGKYETDRDKEISKDSNLSSLEIFLIFALIIFLIIFIYKVAK